MNDLDPEDIVRPAGGAGGGAERASSSSGASDKLWGLYVDLAQGQDKDKTLNWIGDSEGILVFVRVHELQ